MTALAACTSFDKDSTATEPLACPTSKEGYCEYEFGGACPTYGEMAAMMCNGYHFDPTGTSGVPATATDGDFDCSLPIVSCNDPYDINNRTGFYFDGVGGSPVRAVDIIWPETDACPANTFIGEIPC